MNNTIRHSSIHLTPGAVRSGSAWKRSSSLLLGSLLWAGATAGTQALDWPMFRGPDHSGISQETGWQSTWPTEGPKAVWKAKIGTGFATVAVSQGRLFASGNQKNTDTIYCLNAQTGKEIWKYSFACPIDAKYYEGGTLATPTVDGDKVYTISKRGHLNCLEAATGKVVWSKNLVEELGVTLPEWHFAGSPLVEGDWLILNFGSAGTAVEKNTGKVVWTSGKEPSGYSTPVPAVFGGERCVVLFGQQTVMAVKVKDGGKVWEHPWKTRYDVNAADPVLAGNYVFVSSGYDRGCAVLDIAGNQPKVVWESKVMRNQVNSSVLLDGHVYGMDGDAGDAKGGLKCLELKTGKQLWFEPMPSGSVMAANGKLIALNAKGELLVVNADPSGFKVLSRGQVLGGKCWTVPVLANGLLYCRNAQGDLVCLDLRGQ